MKPSILVWSSLRRVHGTKGIHDDVYYDLRTSVEIEQAIAIAKAYKT
jgi:hypothetical protein